MEKKISFFLAILTLGFAQQIFAQDENASTEDTERWSDFLPLNKEMAGNADLPLPFGIGVTGYWQEQDLKSKTIGLAIPAMAISQGVITAANAKVESEVDSWTIRLDTWILPFMNIYGVAGKVDGQNTVVPGLDIQGAPPALALLEAGIETNGFNVPYDGDVYGIGAILAGQWGKYWGTIDYNFTQADLDISTSEIDTHTISPRIGRSGSLGNVKGSLWIGAMHQAIDENHNGQINQGGLDIEYIVLNEQEDEWNFLIGGTAELSKQWNASIEGGLGDRKQVMGNLTFRF